MTRRETYHERRMREKEWEWALVRDIYCKVCEEKTPHQIKNGKKRCLQCLTITILT